MKVQPLHQQPEEVGHHTVLEENHHGLAAHLEEKKWTVVNSSTFPQGRNSHQITLLWVDLWGCFVQHLVTPHGMNSMLESQVYKKLLLFRQRRTGICIFKIKDRREMQGKHTKAFIALEGETFEKRRGIVYLQEMNN